MDFSVAARTGLVDQTIDDSVGKRRGDVGVRWYLVAGKRRGEHVRGR